MSQHQPDNSLRGMVLVAVAVLTFALMDSTTKHLAAGWNVALILAARYIGSLVLTVAVFGPRQGMDLVRTRRTGWVLIRAASLALSSMLVGLAFQRMPVAETTAIVYIAPLGVMLLAGTVLGEKVGTAAWIAVGVGFCGMLLIVRPGSGLDPWGVAFTVLAASSTVAYSLLSRELAKSETTEAMMFWTAVVGAVVFGAGLPWTLHGPLPGAFDAALFVLIGGMATLGHFLFTAAYRHAPASALAPVNYLHLGWAGLLGWLFFGHVPDIWTALGIAMVALAGAGAALYSHLRSNRRALARKGA